MEQWSNNKAQINEGGRNNKLEAMVVVASRKQTQWWQLE